MPSKKLTLRLTPDQQKQIKEATGKDIKEISLAVDLTGQLTEKELELVNAGGLRIIHVA